LPRQGHIDVDAASTPIHTVTCITTNASAVLHASY
jgi:hypothetical protein